MELFIQVAATGEVVPVDAAVSDSLDALVERFCAECGLDAAQVELRFEGEPLPADGLAALVDGATLTAAPSPLHEARGLLRARGVALSDTSPAGLLHAAARAGAADAVALLLRVAGIDTNAPGDDSATPLHAAARGGHARCLELLLGHPDVQVDAADVLGRSALHFAAWDAQEECSWTECMRLLLEAGAPPNARSVRGFAPVHYTGLQREALELLVASGADINARDTRGRTALINRVATGDVEGVRLLLELGADPNLQQSDGMTALHGAVHAGSPDTVRVLLAAGADRNIAMANGKTPLRFAMIYDQVECSYLLE